MTHIKENPFEGAVWIGADSGEVSPVIIRRFSVHSHKKAKLFVTGLGYYEARINGFPVTDGRFLPSVSDYAPRDFSRFLYPLSDQTTHRVYYGEYDVSALIADGENELTIQLGDGFFRQKERTAEGAVWFGERLTAIYNLTVGSGSEQTTFLSDGSETWRESEIRSSSLFYGEIVDPSAVSSGERPVDILDGPDAVLSPDNGIPDRVIRTITPRYIGKFDGRKVYDVGENISGTVAVTTSACTGETITVKFAEKRGDGGELDFESTGGLCIGASGRPQIMTDLFICDGNRRVFEPKFVWHAFRYFDVEGEYDSVKVKVIHADVPVAATFESDSEGLNFLFDAFVRTQLCNMHGSVPSDCPHRERLGYTGDGQVAAPAAMLTLDCRDFYRKWIRDILDCQDQKSGHVQHTAPFMGGGGGPGGWGGAIIAVPYAYYKRYGDLDTLRECYGAMRKYAGYMESRSDGGLVTREEEGGWCLGDWCTLEKTIIPEPFVNTCYFVKLLRYMEDIAVLIGEAGEVPAMRAVRERAEKALISRYRDPSTGSFADGVQGADAYAVWCGIADAALVGRIAEKYDALGHFDTGFLGTDILLEVLFNGGYADTALSLLTGDGLGSFLYMKRRGATTLWEDWRGLGSQCHPMFGACARQLFEGVLGVKQRPDTAGYTDLLIEPHLPEGATYARGSIRVHGGELRVSAVRKDVGITVDVSAPEGVKTEIIR